MNKFYVTVTYTVDEVIEVSANSEREAREIAYRDALERVGEVHSFDVIVINKTK